VLQGLSYVEAVLWLGARLADGLAHAHERGIVHRDLKPANVLLTDDGQPMLLDFNLAHDTKPGAAEVARVGGTLPYMAPEHLEAFRGSPAVSDARSDLYSLGVILYELLTGRLPFAVPGGPPAELLPALLLQRCRPAPRLRPANRAVTPAVEAIVRRLLEPDPQRRYQTARELREDLQRQLDNLPLRHAADRSPGERLRKWVRRHPRLTSTPVLGAVVLVVLAALAAAGVWQMYCQAQEHADRVQGALEATHGKLRKTSVALGRTQSEVVALKRQAARNLEHFQASLHSLRGLTDEVRGAPELFYAHPLCTESADEDRDRLLRALAHYRVLDDPSWQEAERFRLLPGPEQSRVRQDVAELLYLLARNSLFRLLDATEVMDRSALAPLACLPGGRPSPLDAAGAVIRARLAEALDLNHRAAFCERRLGLLRALLLQRAALQRLLGDERAARRLTVQAGTLQPQTGREYYLAGYEHAAQGRFAEALQLAESASQLDPRGSAVWFLLGMCRARLGQPVRAVPCFDVCLGQRPDWLLARYYRGVAHLEAGNYPAACTDLSVVLQARRGFADAYLHRARAKQRLREYHEAEQDVSAALRLRPTVEGFFLRSRLRAALGDRVGAEQDRSAVLEAEPAAPAGLTVRAQVRAQHDAQGALADYRSALARNPRHLPALLGQADLLADRLGRLAEAAAVLDRAVEVAPTDADVYLQRALLLARLGWRGAAHRDVAAALEHDKGPATHYRAACVYALTGQGQRRDRSRAVRHLQTAVRAGYYGPGLERDSRLASLRDEPDFRRLVRAVRLLNSAGP
jgi:tetratricopeptide (TPR) repeat protein